jgi:hypothetical protein
LPTLSWLSLRDGKRFGVVTAAGPRCQKWRGNRKVVQLRRNLMPLAPPWDCAEFLVDSCRTG